MDKKDEQKNEASGQNKEFNIIVNSREKTVTVKKISFAEVVELAFPGADLNGQVAYTVTYAKGEDKKPKGQLVQGDTVNVKPGMEFYVKNTNRS